MNMRLSLDALPGPHGEDRADRSIPGTKSNSS